MNQRESAAAELEKWWLDQAQKQVERTVPKAVDYGSDDLRDLGAWLADSMGLGYQLSDGQLVQLGVTMYLRGKLARVVSAIKDGNEPNPDTWFDLAVYSMMGSRTLEVGAWPGVDLDALDRQYREDAADELVQIGQKLNPRGVVGEQTLCTCVNEQNDDGSFSEADPGCPTHGGNAVP